MINGVLGPIETRDLGFTLMHEHILVANWAMRHCFPGYVDQEKLIRDAIGEMGSLKQRGVRTMVDLTAINLGRDIRVIREVAEKTGMQLIAATGFYWTEEPWMDAWDAEALAEYLIREVREGIEGTDTRAGILKCATDRLGVTPFNKKLLQATARAHRLTGVPISTHTAVSNQSGLAQQDVFEECGVDLGRVVIGHCGDCRPSSAWPPSPSCAAAAGRIRWCSLTTLPASSTGFPSSWSSRRCQTGTTGTSATW